ncbi:MAG: hypothetical protein Q8P00_03360 [Dehalococcoidia bacterium]|nr:hypothetical protein [Dehalococcoidia bacterium]
MISQEPEPQSVERHETTRIDERTSPPGYPAPAMAPPEQVVQDTAGLEQNQVRVVTDQAVRSPAGVEKRERVVTNDAGLEHRESTVHDTGEEHRVRFLKVGQVVWLFVGVIEVLIGLRVFLKLIGANPANDFGGFVYNFAGVFLAPFFGLTGSPSSGAMVLEVPSLIAMLVYALVGWAIVRMILPLFDKPATRSTSTYDRSRS